MAINFAGGTNAIQYAGSWPASGAVGFRLKTTQATPNVGLISQWNINSRNGWGFILNNAAGKLLAQCYGTSAVNVGFSWNSTAALNDGAWHTVLLNYNTANGQSNEYFIDGITESQANSAVAWTNSAANPVCIADSNDAFWASYVGDFDDYAQWNRQLVAAEVEAYAKGFSPLLIAPQNLLIHAPLVRSAADVRGFGTLTTLGAPTQSDHSRVFS